MPPRVTKRIPQSCYDCYKRRVKCNRQIPCDVCIRRGKALECHRETVVVNGQVFNNEPQAKSKIEMLELENQFLKEKLKQFEDIEPEVTEKSIGNQSGLYGMTVNFFSKKPMAEEGNVEYSYEEFKMLQDFLTFKNLLRLIEFNFQKIIIFHCVLIPEIFKEEHEDFFRKDGKHLSDKIEKTRDEYLWLSIYYATISNVLFLLDDELCEELKIDEELSKKLGSISTFAAIECLHRGQYLKYPNIKSLQCYAILCTNFNASLGVHIESALLRVMSYIATTLNLDKLTRPNEGVSLLNFELNCRIWWILVVIYWFNGPAIGKSPVGIHGFTTPRPRNISDFNLLNSIEQESESFLPITYNLYIFEISYIKRSYFQSKVVPWEALELAFLKILNLEQALKIHKQSSNNEYAYFLLHLKFLYEKLEIYKRMISFKIQNHLPIEEERKRCTEVCLELIDWFDPKYPASFRKYWITGNHCVNAAMFLLINMILNQEDINLHHLKKIEMLVVQIQLVFKNVKNPIFNVIPIFKECFEIILKKLNNQSYNLEFHEVKKVLNILDEVPKVYNRDTDLYNMVTVDYWDDFMNWVQSQDI